MKDKHDKETITTAFDLFSAQKIEISEFLEYLGTVDENKAFQIIQGGRWWKVREVIKTLNEHPLNQIELLTEIKQYGEDN